MIKHKDFSDEDIILHLDLVIKDLFYLLDSKEKNDIFQSGDYSNILESINVLRFTIEEIKKRKD